MERYCIFYYRIILYNLCYYFIDKCSIIGSPGKNGTYRKSTWRRLTFILNINDFIVLAIVTLDIEAKYYDLACCCHHFRFSESFAGLQAKPYFLKSPANRLSESPSLSLNLANILATYTPTGQWIVVWHRPGR